MPSRNSKKTYDAPAYYHVYNRGVDRRIIFHDEIDYNFFISLLKRYLDQPSLDKNGREYEWLGGDIEVVAYCLMPNHFHMMIYQTDPEAMTKLLRAVSGSYTVYYNKKYDRSGTLFQGVYRASCIGNEAYFLHITRYIHLNPKHPYDYSWSSLKEYLGVRKQNWVHFDRVLRPSPEDHKRYEIFVRDWKADSHNNNDSEMKHLRELLADH